jgi:hypothetical protein
VAVIEKLTSGAIAAALLLGLGVARPVAAAPLVQECTPPAGVWGTGNAFRSKIQKYSDNTAIYMSQNVATPDPSRWFRSAPFPWGGGQFTNGLNVPVLVTAEGDGYRVATQGRGSYYAHFSCAAAAAAPAPAAAKPR